MNLADLKLATLHETKALEMQVQITGCRDDVTSEGKCFLEILLADSSGVEKVRLWGDSEAYGMLKQFPDLGQNASVGLMGRWGRNKYGLQVGRPEIRALDAFEVNALYDGDDDFRERNRQQWEWLQDAVLDGAAGTPLQIVCDEMMIRHEEPLRRAAAAHGNHHARRGGLLEHICGMMKAAVCLEGVYPEVTPAILRAAVLLHDIGKIAETDYQAKGFALAPTIGGVLCGHIAVGVDMFRALWKELHGDSLPLLRDQVVHCVLSHHGLVEWGSPMEPATPEALILHHLDMIDSRMDMMRRAWSGPDVLVEGVAAVYPLRGTLPRPYRFTAEFLRKGNKEAMSS